MGYLISFHSLQVPQDNFTGGHDVLLDKRHHAKSVPCNTELQYFLMFMLGVDRERPVTPCEQPIAIEVVARAADLLEKEWPVGTRVYGSVEFGGEPKALCHIAGLVDLQHDAAGVLDIGLG